MAGLGDQEERRASTSATGGWTAACFIIAVVVAERFAFCGISFNIIMYLTGPLGQSTAEAATNISVWTGVAAILPLLGGIMADGGLGRYRMICFTSVIYVLGLGLLTLFVALPSSWSSDSPSASSPSQSQVAIFFFLLYLVAVAEGGQKPCVQAFGAGQFEDGNAASKGESTNSFFNWCYFAVCFGNLASQLLLSYIQENVGWTVGFGIPAIAMVASLAMFLLGKKTYRRNVVDPKKYPIMKIVGGLWDHLCLSSSDRNTKEPFIPIQVDEHSHLTNRESEELQDIRDLFPIWLTCLVYTILISQPSTLFTKQGSTVDRHMYAKSSFQVPAAALQSFMTIAAMVFVPIYENLIAPRVNKFVTKTSLPRVQLMFLRIGTGMFMAVVCMVVAALVEMKRLQIAKDAGVVDTPGAIVPMSVWWLVPQYIIFGISQALTMVGLQEVFYHQMPSGMKSFGMGLYACMCGIGSLLSGLLIAIIDRLTAWNRESWFSNNLNRAHLDYFYWLLAVLAAVGLVAFSCCSSNMHMRGTATDCSSDHDEAN